MATRVINGQTFDMPDYVSDADAMSILKSAPSQQQTPTSFTPPAAVGEQPHSIDHRTLSTNKDWLNASKVMFRETQGVDFKGTDEQLSEWGLSRMSAFNNNLMHMSVDAVQLKNAPQRQKQAFLYMLDTFDKVEPSLSGAVRAIGYQLYDPLFLGGLATMGIGSAGGKALQVASKEAFKSALRAGIRGGIEGGIGAAAADYVEQQARINAGDPRLVDGTDWKRVMLSGGIGVAAGGVLGGAIDLGATALRKPVGGQVSREVGQVAEGATLPPTASAVAPEGVVAKDVAQTVASKEGQQVAETVVAKEGQQATKEAATQVAEEAVPHADASTVVTAIRDIAENSGIRIFPSEWNDVRSYTGAVVNTLKQISSDTAGNVMETLARLAKTDEERHILVTSLPQARAAIALDNKATREAMLAATDKDIKAGLQRQLEAGEKLFEAVADLDQRVASIQGSGLGFRAAPENIFTGKEGFRLTQEAIAKEQGVVLEKATAEQMEAIRTEFYRRVEDIMEGRAKDMEMAKLQFKFAEAGRKGDLAEQIKIQREMSDLAETKAKKDIATDTVIGNLYNKIGEKVDLSIRALTEYTTAVVLGPSSLAVNALTTGIKVSYAPLLNFISKGPTELIHAKEMMAAYGGMKAAALGALEAAKMTFKLEKGMLTRSEGAWLSSDPAIAGRTGSVIRVWLRLLSATDEFFQQVAYRGAVSSMAVVEGMEKGLTGKKLDDFIEKRVAAAYKPGMDQGTIDLLRKQANKMGLAGEAADEWIKSTLDANPAVFRRAANEAGRNYTDDLLFKRAFSGEGKGVAGMVSSWAKSYEKVANEHPMFKLVGQLFFKTPVRVFEEGIRLTPGMNIMAPRFIDDLLGKNGDIRRVRALGESMLAFSFGSAVVMAYSSGHITGAGDDKYRQRRAMEDTKDFKPYSIKTSEGNFFTFRNFDPLATPFKIMVNALEKMQDLEYRRAQGEFRNETEWEKAVQWFGVGITSAAQAIRDAQLTEGVTQMSDLITALMDPVDKEKALQKFFGQKAAQLVPNVISKGERAFLDGYNVMDDPITAEQYFRQKINPTDQKVSRQFDVLGYERRTDATGLSAFFGFEISSKADREKGYSKEALAVKQFLELARQATNKTFMPAYKSSLIPGVDLREKMMSDGSGTYYNRAMEEYHKSGVIEALDRIRKHYEGTTKGPIFGTPNKDGKDNSGGVVRAMEATINAYWETSLRKVLTNDREAIRLRKDQSQYFIESITGKREMSPFNR